MYRFTLTSVLEVDIHIDNGALDDGETIRASLRIAADSYLKYLETNDRLNPIERDSMRARINGFLSMVDALWPALEAAPAS